MIGGRSYSAGVMIMNEEKIYNSIKNRVSKEKLKEWTDTLKGFHPLKRDEMLKRFSDRLPVLTEINNVMEELVKEFNSNREIIGEQLRRLQGEYNLGVNYNAVKDTAIKQMIKYSATEEEKKASEVEIPSKEVEERDLAQLSSDLKKELKEIAEALNMEQLEEYPISGGSVDVVWLKKLEDNQSVPVVGFEIETSWRTGKHIKGDIFNLTVLRPILGVILFIKKGFRDEKRFLGNVKATKKYVGEWKKNCAIIILNEEQIGNIKEIIV